ncbi:hypothetical protein FIBSPDRAFT_905189 [Athelia psychrophila]|uniref:Uncharacterized protein n=1 Tax=Athelia psychrophila TaxID=1759441 RepID=A0A167TRU0_9AGAM|nr:hypothetical protein FIBSPDRAFT_905189 [Fibularhizoctonia sp. CBS 109695]
MVNVMFGKCVKSGDSLSFCASSISSGPGLFGMTGYIIDSPPAMVYKREECPPLSSILFDAEIIVATCGTKRPLNPRTWSKRTTAPKNLALKYAKIRTNIGGIFRGPRFGFALFRPDVQQTGRTGRSQKRPGAQRKRPLAKAADLFSSLLDYFRRCIADRRQGLTLCGRIATGYVMGKYLQISDAASRVTA